MATDEQQKVEDMFGSDSESDEETFKGSSVKPGPVNESNSGLFGSDSESDAEEQPKKLKKTTTAAPKKSEASKPPKPAQRKPQRAVDDDDDDASHKPPPRGEGDEYDSGDEVVRSKDDEAFIDEEDDLDGVLGEYNQDNQHFHDERPDEEDEEGGRYSRGGGHEEDYFEDTLKSMKPGRGRGKMKLSQQEIESLVQEVLYKMDKAYNDDQVSMERKVPAFEKLKLVDKLSTLLRKVQLQLPMLDFNLLEVSCSLSSAKYWASESMDRSSVILTDRNGIRLTLIAVIHQFHVDWLLLLPIRVLVCVWGLLQRITKRQRNVLHVWCTLFE
ncbi:hypothetical protein, variant 4 [Aphanomyces astaci]|uniref:TFIIS N-terminal domain-containing protein n=1 Tax=Aphanomyces astaci TaxID=112090 RepID=W4GMF6_APHAT|nr:hypothetical protein, variant 4 [Aphanomyces astaci]ETV80209.1 hypothetical protein, variant 4 [Aphanomyces astaci]|eukprot:XP_009830133.1 hypothetical protein, variant 4 [Aphanomyces astaci]